MSCPDPRTVCGVAASLLLVAVASFVAVATFVADRLLDRLQGSR